MKNWLLGVFFIGALTAVVLWSCDEANFEQGKILYDKFCGNCHGEDGIGLQQLIPPIAGADYYKANQRKLPCIIRYGLSDTIIVNGTTYQEMMPGVPKLSEFEIQNIINYMNNAWGHQYGFTKFQEVQQALKACQNGVKQ